MCTSTSSTLPLARKVRYVLWLGTRCPAATTVSGAGMGVAVGETVEVPLHAARSMNRLNVKGKTAIIFLIKTPFNTPVGQCKWLGDAIIIFDNFVVLPAIIRTPELP
jgi:hypothetical protein